MTQKWMLYEFLANAVPAPTEADLPLETQSEDSNGATTPGRLPIIIGTRPRKTTTASNRDDVLVVIHASGALSGARSDGPQKRRCDHFVLVSYLIAFLAQKAATVMGQATRSQDQAPVNRDPHRGWTRCGRDPALVQDLDRGLALGTA